MSEKAGGKRIADLAPAIVFITLIFNDKMLEAGSGIEPLYEDLQSSA